MIPDYHLIRSKRKTLSVQIRPDGVVLVRAPQRMSKQEIERFLEEKSSWLEKHLRRVRAHCDEAAQIRLTHAELSKIMDRAKAVIPKRVAYYAPLVGVRYGRITIRSQHTRWGSCTAKGDLSFNCLLMLAPAEVLDSVVVHELCHRLEMNHSPAFYREVRRVFPDYDNWNRWLKENGPVLLRQLPEK